LHTNSASKYAAVYYIEGTTKGYDNGDDVKLFGGVSHPFAWYTHLCANNKDLKFQIQSLATLDDETMIIPNGVDATSGQELTFSAKTIHAPSGIKVFLEDRLTNAWKRLDPK